MKKSFLEIWSYRFFIISSIKTELRSRFIRSKLGGLWMILHPLAQVLIYTLILSQIMTAKLPGLETQYAYPIYLLSGMVGWTLFSDILGRSLTLFIDNANLLKKLSFPKLTLPLITVGSSLINFIFLFIMMFIVFSLLGHLPLHALYWIPLLVLITLGLAIGIGLLLGIINIFIRDVGHIMTIILQFWFWLTPVVYMISIIPEKYHGFLMLNPMTGIIMGYQNILVYDKVPDVSLLIYPSVISIIAIIFAMVIFQKANEEMTDIL